MRTRQSILEAAAAEMMQHGYAASSLSSIALRMSLTKGALARQFPTKDELARAVMDDLKTTILAQRELSLAAYPDSGIRATVHFLLTLGRKPDEDTLMAAGIVLLTDRTSPTFGDAGTLAVWNESLGTFFEMAKRDGELLSEASANDLAEYTLVTYIGEVVFAAGAHSPAAQAEPLHFLRFTLRAAGVRHIDAVIDEVSASLGLSGGPLARPSGQSRYVSDQASVSPGSRDQHGADADHQQDQRSGQRPGDVSAGVGQLVPLGRGLAGGQHRRFSRCRLGRCNR